MKLGHDLASDGSVEPLLVGEGSAGRYVAGLSDELGDRVLIMDDEGAPSLELLRFRSTLTTIPGFEVALRRRVERLRQFRHPAFAAPPAVEYLGSDQRLVLLSSYTPGRRLSEVFADAQGPAFASSLVQQLTPALAIFHHYGDGIGHGALTANRIVISPEGRLVIVEHVLGSALERLQLAASPIHLNLGIPVPATAVTVRPRIDGRTDFFQLGLIALSLMVGRPLNADEYPEHLARVLDETLPDSDKEWAQQFRGLRRWLVRALQLNGQSFASSADATDGLGDVSEEVAERNAQRWQELLRETPFLDDITPAALPDEPLDDSAPVVAADLPDELLPAALFAVLEPPAPPSAVQTVEEPKVKPMEPKAVWSNPHVSIHPPLTSSGSRRDSFTKPSGPLKWTVVALALCAIAEAAVIAWLMLRRPSGPPPATTAAEVKLETPDPGATVTVDGVSAGLTPLQLRIGPEIRSISVASPRPPPEQVVGSTGQQTSPANASAPDAKPVAPPAALPARQRLGGIRLSSPIEVEVFEGDTRLGSSATGIITATAGRRELDFVNSALGYRSRQAVDIKDGRVVSVTVNPPNGRININAVPWAEVLIDGKPVGETPIGNLSIPLGEHQIVFRHPQLGEQRRTVVVRLDVVTRLSVNLER